MNEEEILDKVFQAVMTDIGKQYRVSDTLSDILIESLYQHLSVALQAKEKEVREEIAREVEELIQKERFAGAPHALNEVIAIINKK